MECKFCSVCDEIREIGSRSKKICIECQSLFLCVSHWKERPTVWEVIHIIRTVNWSGGKILEWSMTGECSWATL